KPLSTTVIPTYRRPQLLKRAILSVLDQTYQNFQIFVCDNASGDETAQVVAEIAKKDSRVKYYCQEKNIGYPKNFVFGMKLINTPFFSFLSDDDMLLPNFYQTTMEGFNKYPEAMFSTTGLVSVDEKKNRYIAEGLARRHLLSARWFHKTN
ncbi:MAG: glycosyltransferase family A protein, partial [Candidatus Staskawiczbacteria bacterium]|nr:glycosyltransferase family A protein [Candidatus Staskawiczbacteria bacterium]